MRAFFLGLSFVAALAASLAPDAASAQPAFYVIGDCVEYDSSHYNPALRWRRGRVIEIDDFFITIELERPTSEGPVRVAAGNASRWSRPAKGCAAKPAGAGAALPDGVPAPAPIEPDEQEEPPAPPPPLAGRFKVADCIEYDTSNRFRPELRWQKGRILEIDEFFVTFSIDGVEFDPDVPTRVATLQVNRYLRPAKGCAPLKKQQMVQAEKPHLVYASYQSAQQVLPANVPSNPVPGLKCPVRQSGGSRPSEAQLTDVIRCLWQKDSDIEVVRAQIDSFKLGSTRRWNINDDIGNGKPGTTVYPVRVDWRLIRYHRGSVQVSENASVFSCFVNTFDEWECGLTSRIRDGQIVTYRRPRAL